MEATHHIICVPITGRSHVRQHLQLTLNILRVHPSTVCTIIITPQGTSMLAEEMALNPLSTELRDRYRTVTSQTQLEGDGTGFRAMGDIKTNFPEAAVRVLGSPDGEGFDKTPCLFIVDVSLTWWRSSQVVVLDLCSWCRPRGVRSTRLASDSRGSGDTHDGTCDALVRRATFPRR